MNLIKIRLLGFKSFTNETEIHFEKGLNAIIGPNGSGKSNILDAVRWVLGERSSLELRLANKEDVIFAGSENYPPAAMAEVELYFDCKDSKILLD